MHASKFCALVLLCPLFGCDRAKEDEDVSKKAKTTTVAPPAGPRESISTDGVCATGKACDFACTAGGCAQTCAAGSNCVAACGGGRCKQTCAAGATCNFACGGGGCTQSCAPGTSCLKACGGGGCS